MEGILSAATDTANRLDGAVAAHSLVDVLVLEKHGDFLRDFRGDTVHPR